MQFLTNAGFSWMKRKNARVNEGRSSVSNWGRGRMSEEPRIKMSDERIKTIEYKGKKKQFVRGLELKTGRKDN